MKRLGRKGRALAALVLAAGLVFAAALAGAQQAATPPGGPAPGADARRPASGAAAQGSGGGAGALAAASAAASGVAVLTGAGGDADATEPSSGGDASMDANPFAYNLPMDSKGFIPAMEGGVPSGIRVEGIMCLMDGEALAALSVPGYPDLFYVREDDVIALNGAGGGKGKAAEGPTYIQVGKIGPREVELYPKANPSNIHILR